METSQYLDAFNAEARELLQTLNQALLALEDHPDNLESVQELFRATHTLKGMAATMGFDQMALLSHQMESVLDKIRQGKQEISVSLVDLLFSCFDALEDMLERISAGKEAKVDLSSLLGKLKAEEKSTGRKGAKKAATSRKGAKKAAVPKKEARELTIDERKVLEESREKGQESFKIKVSLEKSCVLRGVRAHLVLKRLATIGEVVRTTPSAQDLEDGEFEFDFEMIFVSSESKEKIKALVEDVFEVETVEVSPFALEEGKKVAEATTLLAGAPPKIHQAQTVRIGIDRLDNLMNLVGELVIDRARLQGAASGYESGELSEALDQLEMITSSLQMEVMQVRMVPVGQIFDRFPRMVRDVAHDLGKQIDFIIEGKEIELDRAILDEISDPLVHLLRNAVGHGVESPQERRKADKPEKGRINLSARKEKDHVVIEVADDGCGVDPKMVRKKAVESGFISKEEADNLGEKETIELICHPGFSMAGKTTSLSGRGVGVDAVKAKIEALGGSLEIKTQVGQGSKFILRLPLTLAIIKALLVEVNQQVYAIPLTSVAEIVKIGKDEVKKVRNREALLLHGQVVPLLRLGEVFGQSSKSCQGTFPVVIVEMGEKRTGMAVDAVVGEQEIVIKPLTGILKGVKGLGGATILGDGEVALIVDVRSLI